MTDNEIIKGLGCVRGLLVPCESCGYDVGLFPVCQHSVARDAIDLINRQKAEIEELKSARRSALKVFQLHTEIRAEAIKEFAERLKESFPQGDRNNKCPSLYWDDYCYIIDSLAEEMTEEAK